MSSRHYCASTYTEALDHSRVSQADVGVGEHVLALVRLVGGLSTRLVINANDHEPLVGDRIDEVLASHLDRVDGMGEGREERGQEREGAN